MPTTNLRLNSPSLQITPSSKASNEVPDDRDLRGRIMKVALAILAGLVFLIVLPFRFAIAFNVIVMIGVLTSMTQATDDKGKEVLVSNNAPNRSPDTKGYQLDSSEESEEELVPESQTAQEEALTPNRNLNASAFKSDNSEESEEELVPEPQIAQEEVLTPNRSPDTKGCQPDNSEESEAELVPESQTAQEEALTPNRNLNASAFKSDNSEESEVALVPEPQAAQEEVLTPNRSPDTKGYQPDNSEESEEALVPEPQAAHLKMHIPPTQIISSTKLGITFKSIEEKEIFMDICLQKGLTERFNISNQGINTVCVALQGTELLNHKEIEPTPILQTLSELTTLSRIMIYKWI